MTCRRRRPAADICWPKLANIRNTSPASPPPKKYQETAAPALATRLFAAQGSPEAMLPDNGGEFKSSLTNRILPPTNVKPRYATPARPQADALLDRCNGIVTTALRKIQSACVDVWGGAQGGAAFYYNAKEDDATEKTTYEVAYFKTCATFVGDILEGSDQASAEETPTAPPRAAASLLNITGSAENGRDGWKKDAAKKEASKKDAASNAIWSPNGTSCWENRRSFQVRRLARLV